MEKKKSPEFSLENKIFLFKEIVQSSFLRSQKYEARLFHQEGVF